MKMTKGTKTIEISYIFVAIDMFIIIGSDECCPAYMFSCSHLFLFLKSQITHILAYISFSVCLGG